jgi:hypothetical protein
LCVCVGGGCRGSFWGICVAAAVWLSPCRTHTCACMPAHSWAWPWSRMEAEVLPAGHPSDVTAYLGWL